MKFNLAYRTLLFAIAMSILLGCAKKESDTTKIDSSAPALPSLQAALDEKKNQFEKNAPAEIKKIFDEGNQAVAASGVLETALNVGNTAPDFQLPNVSGTVVTFSEILKKGPVVLIWYRGGW